MFWHKGTGIAQKDFFFLKSTKTLATEGKGDDQNEWQGNCPQIGKTTASRRNWVHRIGDEKTFRGIFVTEDWKDRIHNEAQVGVVVRKRPVF